MAELVTFRRQPTNEQPDAWGFVDPSRAMMDALTEVQAAAGRRYESARDAAIPDFSLTDLQQKTWRGAQKVGWAGFYRDVKALLGSQCTWLPTYKGEVIEDTRIDAVVSLIKPPGWSQTAMRFRAIQLQAGLGEHALWPVDLPSGLVGFRIAHPTQLTKSSQDSTMFGLKTRRDARAGGPGFTNYPLKRLRRVFIPDPEWEDEAWPSLCKALDEIELYEATILNMKRGVNSRLLMNGLLYIPTEIDDTSKGYRPRINGTGPAGMNTPSAPVGGALADLIRDFMKFGGRAYSDTNGNDIASQLPFPFPHHSEPKLIEMGRALDKETLEALEAIVRSAGRGIDIPQQFLVAGEGAASAWSEAELRRALHEQGIFPELQWHDDQFAEYAFRPLLRTFGIADEHEAEFFGLASDHSAIQVKSDQTSVYFNAVDRGIARRDWAAQQMGIPEEGRVELPAGVTDYDLYREIAGIADLNDGGVPGGVGADRGDTNDLGGETGMAAISAAALKMLPAGPT